MLIINIKALIGRRGAMQKRRITYKAIEKEAGFKALTLSRIATDHDYNLSRRDLEKLLICFNCQPNDISTLIKEKE